MVPLQYEADTALSAMASVSLDVDITFFFQLGLFFTLMVLLRALVFRPYLDNLDARTARTSDTVAAAEELRAKADALAKRHADALASARAEGLGERGGLRIAGQAHKDEAVTQARADAAKTRAVGQAKVNTDIAAAREELLGQVGDIARLVAEKVLGRSV